MLFLCAQLSLSVNIGKAELGAEYLKSVLEFSHSKRGRPFFLYGEDSDSGMSGMSG